MEFDVHALLPGPARDIAPAVAGRVKDIAARLVGAAARHFLLLEDALGPDGKIDGRAARLVVFQLCQDGTDDAAQRKVRSARKICHRVLGGLEGRCLRHVDCQIAAAAQEALARNGLRLEAEGAAQLAVCVAEVCSMLLRCASDCRALGDAASFERCNTICHLSNGDIVPNASLSRLLHYARSAAA